MLLRTPLYPAHLQLGARMVDFGGWEMPVQYSGIRDEHLAVRSAAGLFDISHMGEIEAAGPASEAFLNGLLTNDLRKLTPGAGQYTLLCLPDGGVLDDLFAYRTGPDTYLLVVNATRVATDFAWIERRLTESGLGDGVRLANASADLSALAIQGPLAPLFIDRVLPPSASAPGDATPLPASQLPRNCIARHTFRDQPVWCARTGYTGEDGFELVAPNAIIAELWNVCLDAGRPHGLKPCGLGARDTLRTEMGFPLYGQELTEERTPIEAGLDVFVALDKPDFCGRERMARQKQAGLSHRRVAFRMTGTGAPPPRPHYPIRDRAEGGAQLGETTSGTLSPSLGLGIGMAYLPAAFATPGQTVWIEIRGRRYPAEIARRPLYCRPSGKPA